MLSSDVYCCFVVVAGLWSCIAVFLFCVEFCVVCVDVLLLWFAAFLVLFSSRVIGMC